MTAEVICLRHDWVTHPSGYTYCRVCGGQGYLMPVSEDDEGDAS